MSDIIESNPQILGGKPVIKGTRIPVALIYELIGLNYSIAEILKEYPHLDSKIILTLLKIGRDASENLMKTKKAVNYFEYLECKKQITHFNLCDKSLGNFFRRGKNHQVYIANIRNDLYNDGRDLRKIYNEFWDVIDEENEAFQEFIITCFFLLFTFFK